MSDLPDSPETGFWYIIHIYSGHEKKVKLNLEQRAAAMNLDHQIREVVLPMREFTKIKGGKRRTVDEPSFPGYILIRTNNELKLDSEDEAVISSWHLIRETPGVVGFVGPGNSPTVLSDQEVENILNLSEEVDEAETSMAVEFNVEDTVRVIEGPFKGFLAEINGIDQERHRFHLTIMIFGRATPIDLSFTEVEKHNEIDL